MLLLLVLAACNGTVSSTDKPGDSDDTGDTVDSADSGDTGDTGGSEGDVVGPDLPACTPQTVGGDFVALSGVVLAPDGPTAGVVVYSRSNGLITCVGDCDVASADVVCTEGVISAGLIDAHNHLQYNTLPPWQVDPEFDNRYEWRSDDRYYDYRTAYDVISDTYDCEIDKWAEARELIHGTTSTVGSSGGSCIDVLIRNLDEDSGASGVSSYDITYSAGTVTDTIDSGDCSNFTSDLASGAVDAVIEHVGEGVDADSTAEVEHMLSSGCVGPGESYVHAVGATTAQMAEMAATSTSIVWSPRSNLALYGTTTAIEIADRLGVPWAIGTDWTPSGSMAPTRELECAAEWLESKGNPISDVRLWEKSTTDAARVVGLDGVIGALAPGYRADIAVFDWSSTPYRAIIQSEPTSVRLVIVEGAAQYGYTDMVSSLAAHAEWCEPLDVCGDSRSICVAAADSGEDAQTIDEVADILTAAMADVSMPSGFEYGAELFPLYTCTEERPTCNLSTPTSGDSDGDGIADTSDLCPDIYDPNQWDTDGDGIGDSCDDCPLDASNTDCTPDPGDADGDGVADEADNCPTTGNADQTDRDSDGIGDACDACPDEPNPDGSCSATIHAVRDPSDPNHPSEGTTVTLQDVVVTAVKSGAGFYITDLDEPSHTFAGLYVYDHGKNTVAEGDVLTVSGVYVEYYDMSELTGPTVAVTGTRAFAPEPVSACDVGTGGALAEAYESMLVRAEDLTVTNTNADDPDDYQEYEVNDCLRVDDWLYTYEDQPPLDTHYDAMTGILTYSFSNFKLLPRSAADIE